mmetsp:Transcript_24884/g.71099  ORF Transcript_24884/g.71099 Transcript_24884/m.71099 type:complete len:280 (+) Transcript_24884:626-1465(+)
MGATLTDVTVSADDGLLTSKHDISGTHDTVGKRVLASVQVVEFRLGDGVVHVDSSEKERSVLLHGVKTVDTGGGFLRNSEASGGNLVPLVGLSAFQKTLEDGENNLELSVVSGAGIGKGSVLQEKVFGLLSFVDNKSHITTVVDDEVGSVTLAVILLPSEGVQCALPVFFQGFSLPCEDGSRFVTGDGGSGVVLGGKDVARAPTNVSSEILQSFDKDGSLDGHVKGSRNTSTSERLGGTVLGTASHKSRHLNLSELNILATVVSEGNISDLVISGGHVG